MADVEMIAVTEFTCPRCGSHKFGTTLEAGASLDASTMIGHCYGEETRRSSIGIQFVRCLFTWRRNDDAKFFRDTGLRQPAVCVGTVV